MTVTAVCLTGTTANAQEDSVISLLSYRTVNGSAEITACDKAVEGDIIIPAEIDGYPVTKIGDYAFFNCYNLTGVTLPEGISSIGNGAFAFCFHLAEVQLPDTLNEIGAEAFANCCEITEIFIPSGVASIGKNAFTWCDSLSFTQVDENNRHFSCDENGVLFNDDKSELIRYPAASPVKDYVIPDTVEKIADNAFGNGHTFSGSGSNLESIILPDSVSEIGESAFSGCDSLSVVILPEDVTSIGADTFKGCSALQKAVAPGVSSVAATAFDGCKELDTFITFADNLTVAPDAFSRNLGFCVFAGESPDVSVSPQYRTVTFSCEDDTISFYGEYKSDLYYLFDLVTIMCMYYDGIDYLYFESFEAYSSDSGHIYCYTDNFERIMFDCKVLNNLKLSVEVFENGDFTQYSFNKLCSTPAAMSDSAGFNIVIEESDKIAKGTVGITLSDGPQSTMIRLLKALTNLINKLFSFFRKLGR